MQERQLHFAPDFINSAGGAQGALGQELDPTDHNRFAQHMLSGPVPRSNGSWDCRVAGRFCTCSPVPPVTVFLSELEYELSNEVGSALAL